MKFDEKVINKVWEHSRGMADMDSDELRRDECGAWIKRDHYGSTSMYGWKIENVSAGGSNDVSHLRPFHHANSYDCANGKAHCRATAEAHGTANIIKE